jgi:hypothetical protein
MFPNFFCVTKEIIFICPFVVKGKMAMFFCPEEPVRQLVVKVFVQQFDIENLLPRGMEGVEVGDGLLLRVDKTRQRERGKDVEVAAVGVREVNAADESHFAQDIFALVELVSAAIDDGDGESVAVLEDHHDGHGEEAIDLAGDAGEFASGVVGALQLDGDEDVRFEQAALDGIVGEEGGFAAEFLVGELEDQVGGFPIGDEGFFFFVERVS